VFVGIALAAMLGACTEGPELGSPDAANLADTPSSSAASEGVSQTLEVARFEGSYDPDTGEFDLRTLPLDAVVSVVDGEGLRQIQQARYCDARVVDVSDGIVLATVATSVGTTPAECIPADELAAWSTLFYDDGVALVAPIAPTPVTNRTRS